MLIKSKKNAQTVLSIILLTQNYPHPVDLAVFFSDLLPHYYLIIGRIGFSFANGAPRFIPAYDYIEVYNQTGATQIRVSRCS
jgi:hypothetical protein